MAMKVIKFSIHYLSLLASLKYIYFYPNLPSLILALFCEENGECTNSILLAFLEAKSMQECMEKCQTYETCQYGTFRSDKNLCVLFQTCINIQENEFCPSCKTSSPKCDQSPPG